MHFVDSNRRPAGFGHIDFGPIAAALAEIGYDGLRLGRGVPVSRPRRRGTATIDAYRSLFQRKSH